ncbi:hypothetical protein MMC26_004255 [Xylographa opegraphella]|nr:hypothetical protein [Xylographa opegraphella]
MVELYDTGQFAPSPSKPSPLDTMQTLAPPFSQRYPQRQSSEESLNRHGTSSPNRKPVPFPMTTMGTRIQEGPVSPVHINNSSDYQIPEPSSTEIEDYNSSYFDRSRTPSGEQYPAPLKSTIKSVSNEIPIMKQQTLRLSPNPFPNTQQSSVTSLHQLNDVRTISPRIVTPEAGDPYNRQIRNFGNGSKSPHDRNTSDDSVRSNVSNGTPRRPPSGCQAPEMAPSLQYHHQQSQSDATGVRTANGAATGSAHRHSILGENFSRPASALSATSEFAARGRTRSPQLSPNGHNRNTSSQGTRSPDNRPISFIDLLNVPYPQPAPSANIDNAHLRVAVGANASLLSTKKTLEMYRANLVKTNDPAIQYEFAIFMINAAQEATANGQDLGNTERQKSPMPVRNVDGSAADERAGGPNSELLREAKQILQRLSDKSYPYAQYYLADGYASGLFNRGREDNDRAFPLFVASSKHGHAEAGYRAALCYEFGWGTRSDPTKAVQFYRQAASKNHPGAMTRLALACLGGELALGNRYREGLKWLKRATEAADFQYNSAPYELGLLHETGYGADIFQDESYTAQLFTQSADLGHAEANYRLGDAYEHGKLTCPRDPALSVHFYTGAAQRGHPLAMMALCAWYMVGAEPVLEKDENEAYEWALKAAESGLPKAQYAVGYFTEMGIGCRRDPLEANVWYVRAADLGDERAKHRINAISAAASGGTLASTNSPPPRRAKKEKSAVPAQAEPAAEEKTKWKRWGIF